MPLPPPRPTSATNSDPHQQAINYSTLAVTAAAVAAGGGAGGGGSGVKSSSAGPPSDQNTLSSTETLLRNIQSLLTVAADNARQQERQITYEKGKKLILPQPIAYIYTAIYTIHTYIHICILNRNKLPVGRLLKRHTVPCDRTVSAYYISANLCHGKTTLQQK